MPKIIKCLLYYMFLCYVHKHEVKFCYVEDFTCFCTQHLIMMPDGLYIYIIVQTTESYGLIDITRSICRNYFSLFFVVSTPET